MRPPDRTEPSRGQAFDVTDVIRRQRLDDLVDGYVNWRDACVVVRSAYDRWKYAASTERKPTFSEYLEALGREEDAATRYQGAVERVAAMDDPATPVTPQLRTE